MIFLHIMICVAFGGPQFVFSSFFFFCYFMITICFNCYSVKPILHDKVIYQKLLKNSHLIRGVIFSECQRKSKGQSRMNNTETQEALAQDTGRRQITLGTRHRAETNNTGHKKQGADKQHWTQETGRRRTKQKVQQRKLKTRTPPKSEPSSW